MRKREEGEGEEGVGSAAHLASADADLRAGAAVTDRDALERSAWGTPGWRRRWWWRWQKGRQKGEAEAEAAAAEDEEEDAELEAANEEAEAESGELKGLQLQLQEEELQEEELQEEERGRGMEREGCLAGE